jgi:hypothetical protein
VAGAGPVVAGLLTERIGQPDEPPRAHKNNVILVEVVTCGKLGRSAHCVTRHLTALTYMATPIIIRRCEALSEFELPEWEEREPRRSLWVSDELVAWADNTMQLHRTKIDGRTLFEQLEQTFCDFRCSPSFHAADLKRMMPTASKVWHMYPPDYASTVGVRHGTHSSPLRRQQKLTPKPIAR